MPANPVALAKLYETLDGEKQNFATYFQEVTDYVLPAKSNVRRWSSPGERRGTRRYDSTAVDAVELLAASMASSLTNPSQKWFSLTLANQDLAEEKEVRDWLQFCSDRMLSSFAASNFYSQIDEAYLDLAGYGTTAIMTTEAPPNALGMFGGLTFESWPIRDYVFTEGETGRVDTVLRKFDLTARQAQERFERLPRFQGIGEKATKAVQSQQPKDGEKKFTFLHIIRPRAQRQPRRGDPTNLPIESIYLNLDEKHVVHEGGYHEMPVAVPRWRKNNDDAGWGRSPALTAMPAIRVANEAMRLSLKAWAKDIDPPLLVEHKGVIGSLTIQPSGINYVRRDARLEYLTSGGKYDVSQFKISEVRDEIRSMFLVDQIRSLVGDPQPGMTAFEYSRRLELMQRMLGPTFGRLQHELLDPVVFRVFQSMFRGFALPDAPPLLQDAAQAGMDVELEVEYVGPLARAQKAQDIEAIERAFMFGGMIAQSTGDTSHLDRLDADAAIRESAMLMGVPSDVIRSDEDVQARAEARAQAAQEAQEMAQAQAAVGMAGDVAQVAGAVS